LQELSPLNRTNEKIIFGEVAHASSTDIELSFSVALDAQPVAVKNKADTQSFGKNEDSFSCAITSCNSTPTIKRAAYKE
jgi:hypothetical protein